MVPANVQKILCSQNIYDSADLSITIKVTLWKNQFLYKSISNMHI